MEVKRKLDTANATYDILGLNREQFAMIRAGYEERLMYKYHSSEEDELLKKLNKMLASDTLIF